MAEKGVVVEDATSGESVACRDAVQTDDDSNARVVQLVDRASRPVTYQVDTPVRSAVSTSDSADVGAPLATVLENSIIDVSDAESCVIWAIIDPGSTTPNDGLCVVTPLIIGSYYEVIATLPPIQLRPVYPKTAASAVTGITDAIRTASYKLLVCAQSFQTLGATSIAFHITISDTQNNGFSVDLYAAPTSSAYRNVALDQEVSDGKWGNLFVHDAT